MSARIEAETPAAKAMIVDNLPALRERLSTHDIKLMHFDVELAPDSQRHPQNSSGQEQSSPRGRSFGRQSHVAAASPEAPRRPTATAPGKLDVLI
jgi:flagellar hook-length control protein FliK